MPSKLPPLFCTAINNPSKQMEVGTVTQHIPIPINSPSTKGISMSRAALRIFTC